MIEQPKYPPKQSPNSELFWLTILFFLIVFYFFDGHDISRAAHKGGSIEQATTKVEEGSLKRRISLICLLGFGVITLLRNRGRKIRINGVMGWLSLLFLVWSFLSLTWAVDVSFTFRRLVVLAMLCISGLAIARQFSRSEIALLVFYITTGFLFLGLAAEITMGTFHPLDSNYRLTGTTHPNHIGINCALLILSAVCLLENPKNKRVFFGSILIIALFCLILTKSRTSFGSAILAILVYWFLFKPLTQKLTYILFLSIFFSFLLYVFGDAVFPALQQGVLLGRESDSRSIFLLTGRVPLWLDCFEFIARRPILGYGYGSFWTPEHIAEISTWQQWGVSEAHSGYVELALWVGIVGLVIYLLILWVGISQSFRYHRKDKNAGYAFFAVLLLFCFFEGLLESANVFPSFLSFLSIVAIANLGFIQQGKS